MKGINLAVILLMTGVMAIGQPGKTKINKTSLKSERMNTILLMKKRILLDSSKVLFDKPLNQEDFLTLWTVHHSKWAVKDGWLEGENPGNWPGMAVLKQDFPGNVLVEFEA